MGFPENCLLEYACSRFEEGNYKEALEAFVLAYGKGQEQDWILENIYRCYMDANEMAFREAYEKQADKLECEYSMCTLDFIPCQDEEYFIFDKEKKLFLGKLSVKELLESESSPVFHDMEFSAAAVELDWDWRQFAGIFAETKNREIYAVCHDINRAASFGKIPELSEYMEHIRVFSDRHGFQKYFHKNTAVYMPQIVTGSEESIMELGRILKEEHQYRLTPEGRNTENVLLTIGIPTHDRGNILLKRLEKLRDMPYDAEIEIAISKNGTHYYQEEYRSVEAIEDARITYSGYDRELGMSQNWQNVIKIAHGKFVLLVSDEDDVILTALEHYLKLLKAHERLGYVRSRTKQQYNFITENKYYKKGEDAFLAGFLGQNYLSGAIYNRKCFLESEIEEYSKRYRDNEFYRLYPHVWWQSILAFKGDYAIDAVCLIQEGESVLVEENLKYWKDNIQDQLDKGMVDRDNGDKIPVISTVSTYAERIRQFQGGVELIKDFSKLDRSLKRMALWRLAEKTLHLMNIVRCNFNYNIDEFPSRVKQLMEELISAMNELMLDGPEQIWILGSFAEYVEELAMES